MKMLVAIWNVKISGTIGGKLENWKFRGSKQDTVLKWDKSNFKYVTLGLNTMKNTDYIKKCLKKKLLELNFQQKSQ